MAKKIVQKAPAFDFVLVGKSRIEGRGVFAKRKIPKGTRIIEYRGKRRTLVDFCTPHEEAKTAPVVAFFLDEKTVIDPTISGNDARFINHSCQPNCESYVFDRRLYIYAIRDIRRGEELTFDYQLRSVSGKIGDEAGATHYPCRCGSENCRGTLLSRLQRKSRR